MTTGQLAALAISFSLLFNVALSYFGIPARVQCTIAAQMDIIAHADEAF